MIPTGDGALRAVVGEAQVRYLLITAKSRRAFDRKVSEIYYK